MDILDPSTPVKNAIFIYMLVTMFLLHHKPSFIFTHQGRCQSFGMCKRQKDNKNILTLIMILTSTISYFLFLIINIMHT